MDATDTGAMMPQYQSHKKVGALKIKAVLVDEGGVGIQFEAPGFAVCAFTNDQLKNKPTPQAGMYMVVYQDGYRSFSPGDAFEEGYTLVPPVVEQCDYKLALSFGDLVVRYADADYIRARFEMMPPAEFYAAYVEPAFRQLFTAKDQATTPAVLKD